MRPWHIHTHTLTHTGRYVGCALAPATATKPTTGVESSWTHKLYWHLTQNFWLLTAAAAAAAEEGSTGS